MSGFYFLCNQPAFLQIMTGPDQFILVVFFKRTEKKLRHKFFKSPAIAVGQDYMYLSRLDASRSSLLCTVGLLRLSSVPKMASLKPAA